MKIDGFNRVTPIGSEDANGPDSHIISGAEASTMLTQPLDAADPFRHVLFHDAAFDVLRGQPGHVFIGAAAVHNGHHNTILFFSANASGQPLLAEGFVAIENGERCPPFC